MEIGDAESLRNIIEKFKDCPRIVRFFVTTGSFNLFALIWVEDYHTLESVSLEKCSLRAQKGIRRFEIYPVQEVYYEPSSTLELFQKRALNSRLAGSTAEVAGGMRKSGAWDVQLRSFTEGSSKSLRALPSCA